MLYLFLSNQKIHSGEVFFVARGLGMDFPRIIQGHSSPSKERLTDRDSEKYLQTSRMGMEGIMQVKFENYVVTYPVVIHKDDDSDYGVTVPDLPGCFSAGSTMGEALANAKEAIECHIKGLVMDNEEVPEPLSIDKHIKNPDYKDGVWALVDFDYGKIEAPMKLFSYIVAYDTGFSPNPFWGYCTLADCKPVIRRTAEVGDWIVGLSPKATGNRVVFAMIVDEILDYASYFHDRRFANKIPDYCKGEVIYKTGDNIYMPLPNGDSRQLQSMHSHGQEENPENKAHDLGGVNVLIGKTFHYFGGSGPYLPEKLNELKVGRGHKNRFSPKTISNFQKFISSYPQGVIAPPTNWPSGDTSWKQQP